MCGKKMSAELTNMDEPLGLAVGNSLEVIEAIDTLNGHGPKDFTELCMEVSAELILDSGLAKSHEEAYKLALRQIENKEALHKFVELVDAQGGDSSYILNPDKFPKAKYIVPVTSTKDGYVTRIDALAIGHASMYLGGGRAKMDDKIDHAVGIVVNKKVGDYVEKGEVLAYIHANKVDVSLETKCVFDAYAIGDTKIQPKLILKVVK
jgi:pyrimidine-nucleoside phosphorylase